MSRSPIAIRIDELALATPPKGGERHMRETVQREVRRLIERSPSGGGKPRRPESVEQQIARRIHQELQSQKGWL